jgi:hypothetical protein
MTSVFAIRTNTPFTSNTRLRATQPFTANSETLIANEDNLILNNKFKTTLNQVTRISNLYSKGEYEELNATLTTTLYSQLSLNLVKLKNKFNDDYERIRRNAKFALQGAYRALVQYNSLQQTLSHNEILAERASILDDNTKLAAYIDSLNNTRRTSIFGDHIVTTTVNATIDPEYLLYIQTFGFPEDGIFDADKLGKMRNAAS